MKNKDLAFDFGNKMAPSGRLLVVRYFLFDCFPVHISHFLLILAAGAEHSCLLRGDDRPLGLARRLAAAVRHPDGSHEGGP